MREELSETQDHIKEAKIVLVLKHNKQSSPPPLHTHTHGE